MSHLGERLTALVDGELGHADRDRALTHLAGCDSCRAEADMLRRIKRRVHELPDPDPSMGLMSSLFGLSDPGEPLLPRPPRELPRARGALESLPGGESFGQPVGLPGAAPGRSLPPAAVAAAFLGLTDSTPLGSRPFGTRHSTGRGLQLPGIRRVSARGLVVGAFSLAAVTVGTAFLAGGSGNAQSPAVSPPVRSYAVEHALTTSGLVAGGAPAATPIPTPAPGRPAYPAAFRSPGP